jgi:hypothetical protein
LTLTLTTAPMMEQDSSAATSRVFISYSHDSPEHQQRVLALANQLRKDGVEAWLDQYVQDPKEGWIRWMRSQVQQANRVLLVFSEAYQRRFQGNEEEVRGLGATFEGIIVTQALYESAGHNEKFRPVVFREGDERFIPAELRCFNCYRVDTPEHYEALLRWLLQAPQNVAPHVLPKRDLPPHPAPELFPPTPDGASVGGTARHQLACATSATHIVSSHWYVPRIEKEAEITSILHGDSDSRVCILVGPSGFGKTALAASLFDGYEGTKIWLNATDPVVDLLHEPDADFVVIDSIEDLYADICSNSFVATRSCPLFWMTQAKRAILVLTCRDSLANAILSMIGRSSFKRIVPLAGMTPEQGIEVLTRHTPDPMFISQLSTDQKRQLVANLHGCPLLLVISLDLLKSADSMPFLLDDLRHGNLESVRRRVFSEWFTRLEKECTSPIGLKLLYVICTVPFFGMSARASSHCLDVPQRDVEEALVPFLSRGLLSPANGLCDKTLVPHPLLKLAVRDKVPFPEDNAIRDRFYSYFKVPRNNPIDDFLTVADSWSSCVKAIMNSSAAHEVLIVYTRWWEECFADLGLPLNSCWIAASLKGLNTKTCGEICSIARALASVTPKSPVLAEAIWGAIYTEDNWSAADAVRAAGIHWNVFGNPAIRDSGANRLIMFVEDVFRYSRNGVSTLGLVLTRRVNMLEFPVAAALARLVFLNHAREACQLARRAIALRSETDLLDLTLLTALFESKSDLLESHLRDCWHRIIPGAEFLIFMEFLASRADASSFKLLVSTIQSLRPRPRVISNVNPNRALFPALYGGSKSLWDFILEGGTNGKWTWAT